ncbi:LysR family transcriptional regulator [Streptomyces sp. NPDC097610]|uniref:LysR family transcriptional regulator n=1 Tax=Streptomyces sp. NPDC097610 TaxID=3157227 RepID=UPI0033199F80
MDIDTRLLRYFAAVVEEGNLSRAAERLYVSQPALTKQIRRLEDQLGVGLFVRSRAGMTPTEAGQALAAHAGAVLTAWEHTLRAARAATTRAARTLRVGFVASAANEHTQLIIADFARRRPGWRVQMRQAEWTDPTAGLATGEADVALLRLPVPAQSDFNVEVLLTEPRWIALSAGHHLAAKEHIRFQDVYDEPFVATPAESGAWRDYWLATDEREGHPVRIGAVAHHPDEWLNAIAHGQCVSLTPEATARFYQRPDVVYRPVTGVSPSRIGVAWPRSQPVADTIGAFVRSCRAVCNDGRLTDSSVTTDR